MEKNWLIRTKNNHILGPVSKAKIQELVGNGSVKGDDELCSGNGYWFYIKEKDLLDKFVYGDEGQGFNPISEAPTVLAASKDSLDQAQEIIEESSHVENTMVLNLNDLDLTDVEESNDKPQLPKEEPTIDVSEEVSTTLPKGPPTAVASNVEKKPFRISEIKKSLLSDRILLILSILFVLIALFAFKKRKEILGNLIETSAIGLVAPAFAQIPLNEFEKKKYS